MEDLIARYGLAAIFIGACIEGDVVLVLGGVVAHLGLLNPILAVACGAAGCLTNDLAWFFAGRSGGTAIRESRAYRAIGPTVERIADRLGPLQILASRLVYGTRAATMLFWGVRGLAPARFLLIDLAGCAVWASLLCGAGYLASHEATLVMGEVRRTEWWLLGALCIAAVVFFSVREIVRLRRRRETRAEGSQGPQRGDE